MKVLGIYGSPRKGGNTDQLLDKALEGTGAFDHMAFRAEDPDLLAARLKAKGYSYREREVPDLGLLQIFVEDPNGVTVELNYWGADSKAA